MARRLLVMAHWRKTPEEIKVLSDQDLEIMEFSFLLLERRQTETYENLVGGMLGTSWDAKMIMGGDSPAVSGEDFTWSLRPPRPRVFLPLTVALTQNPKFGEHLKQLASSAVNRVRENKSVLDTPAWYTKKEELVDLSYLSKEEFLRYANALPSN